MWNRKGQNVAEYSVLIALVIGAAIVMQIYVKRGLQGRVRDGVDYAPAVEPIAGKTLDFSTKQYEPYYIDSDANVVSNRYYNENIVTRGETTRAGINEETKRERGAYEKQTWNNYNTY